MELFYAHYPSLETSFLHFFSQQRRTPLEPWLVVCASASLAQRLSSQLARTYGAVANIHFCTGSSLVYRLDEEAGPDVPVFPQNHLRDFLLQEVLQEPGLNRYPVSRGFINALKEALRDLADSLADPDILEEHLRTFTDESWEQDKERFAWLVRVYRRYLQREAQMPGYRPYQALFERALAQVEGSSFLRSFSKIIFYGFYDMPGRQLELLRQIAAHYRPVVFAPYAKYPSYQFAKKFFETNWLGAAGGGKDVNDANTGALGASASFLFAAQGSAPAAGVRIVPAADPQSEVFFAAKEILRLTQEEGFSFSDIGVIVRAQAPYQEEIRRVFAQNCIALNAAFSYPLVEFPIGAFCLNLLSLDVNSFSRGSVLGIVSSAYFKPAHKAAWRRLAEKSLVSLNLNQWRDLLPQTEGYDPAFLDWLERVQTQLQQLSKPGRWEEQCRQARALLTENIDIDTLQGKELEIYQAVCACIDSLADYRTVRPNSHPGEFVRELVQALSGLCFHQVQATSGGVTFTDVLHARGLSFPVVFLLGVNEKVFPQLIAEDPVFRDRYRYVLRDVLGYWVSQKSERVQEERLLFFTALTAASRRVYVSYACRGEDGQEKVPSVYVAELARAAQQTWSADEKPHISDRFVQRLDKVSPLLLTPKEVSCAIMLQPQDRVTQYRAAGLFTEQVPRWTTAACALNQIGPAGKFDGFIQSGPAVLAATQPEGVSPSALQELAACPMKYFFHRVLHLADKEDTYTRHSLAADKRGTAYHQILEDFYRTLLKLGLTHQLFDSAVAQYLDRVLSRYYTRESYRLFGIYPVVWELILEQLRERLLVFLQEDIKALGTFTPTYFERAFSALEIPGLPLRLRGIIDRIDIDPEHKTFIIADYKSSRKGGKDLAAAFFTHLIFQPFLYALAARHLPELKGYTLQGACLLSIQKGYDRRDMPQEQWTQLRPQAQQFLKQLAGFMEQGSFFLNPSELCAYCPYQSICRKDSFKCLMRARKSRECQQLEEARYGN